MRDESGITPSAPVSLTSGDTQSSARDVVTPQGLHARPSRSGRDVGNIPRPAPSTPRAHAARAADPGVIIKITDFGIAKILDAQGVTSTGQVLGSPAHMAPEQIEGGEVDARTDVFALGVLLYECLVGHLPFEGKNPAQVLRRVLEGTYAAVDRERPSVGGRWASIVAAALARDPADRIASPAQLGDRIQAELEAVGCPDGRVEIAAYFADPAAYIEAHTNLLVPRLTARGEAARKAGDVWGAAADWNRALALAPNDLTLLKRVAGLTSSASRRLMLRRAAVILAGSTVLGLGAFAVARTLKARDLARGGVAVASTVEESAPTRPELNSTAEPEPAPRKPPVTSTSAVYAPTEPTARAPRVPATPVVAVAPPPVSSVRNVRFLVNPGGALLAIDGSARTRSGETMQLSVGTHAAVMTMPRDRTSCCKTTERAITVEAPPAGKPDEPMVIPLSMDLNPARVSLSANAPPGARVSCNQVGVNISGATEQQVTLTKADMAVSCTFSAPGRPERRATITLKAGEPTSIRWPE